MHDSARPRGPEHLRYKANGTWRSVLLRSGEGWQPRMAAPCHPSDDTAAWLVVHRRRRYFGYQITPLYARVDEHEVRACLDGGAGCI